MVNFKIKMNLYKKITLSQLIILWVFGLIIFLALASYAEKDDSPGGVVISFVVIIGGIFFYTLGWRKYKKQHSQEKKD